MNYFEHHIGDYDSATAHLSIIEDGVYGRLMRVYYRTETPIPADLRQACRLVRAQSKPERDAVGDVLREFFELRDDGWHNRRCDEEIARYQDKQRKARASADARWGAHKPQSVGNANGHANAYADASPPAMRTHTEGNATREHGGARAPARPQSPDTKHQTPEIQGAPPDATTSRARSEADPEPESPGPAPGSGSPYGLAVLAMRQQGMDKANPGDPRLRALVDAGCSVEEFQAAAREAVDKGKGFAWALVALTNRRAEVAANPIAAAPVEDWRETRAGVDSKARELGLQCWSEWEDDQIARGVAPQYAAYRRTVLTAAGANP